MYLAREMDKLRCFAPLESAVINGRLMSVLVEADSSHFAFSAASLSRCTANLSFDRSMPCISTSYNLKAVRSFRLLRFPQPEADLPCVFNCLLRIYKL